MAMMNQLGASPDDGQEPPGAPPALHPLVAGMGALHDMTKARYDKLAEARQMLDKVRLELTPLARMGETVSQDDVIKVAGKLVGHGLGAGAVAGLLADMPQEGQALAAWVAQHLQGISAREAQLAPVLASTRHQLGVHALQLLAAHSMTSPQPQPEANPMTGGEPPSPGGDNSLGATPSSGGSNAS